MTGMSASRLSGVASSSGLRGPVASKLGAAWGPTEPERDSPGGESLPLPEAPHGRPRGWTGTIATRRRPPPSRTLNVGPGRRGWPGNRVSPVSSSPVRAGLPHRHSAWPASPPRAPVHVETPVIGKSSSSGPGPHQTSAPARPAPAQGDRRVLTACTAHAGPGVHRRWAWRSCRPAQRRSRRARIAALLQGRAAASPRKYGQRGALEHVSRRSWARFKGVIWAEPP